MEESILAAKQIAEDILSFFGINADVSASHDEDVITLDVPSTSANAFLIGSRGETLAAVQSLISSIMRSKGYEAYRVNFDVAGYKAGRQKKIVEEVIPKLEKVRQEGIEIELEPMNAADRRAVHKEAVDYSGITTESRGEGRDRYIVLKPEE